MRPIIWQIVGMVILGLIVAVFVLSNQVKTLKEKNKTIVRLHPPQT